MLCQSKIGRLRRSKTLSVRKNESIMTESITNHKGKVDTYSGGDGTTSNHGRCNKHCRNGKLCYDTITHASDLAEYLVATVLAYWLARSVRFSSSNSKNRI
jgi:hypothetical protein